MLWKRKLQLYGGDLRMLRLAELFAQEKYMVFLYGQSLYFQGKAKSNQLKECATLEECISQSDLIVSGVPFTKDEKIVMAPFAKQEIEVSDIYKNLENKVFVAGGIPKWFYANGTIQIFDLLECEELTILNAIPTAEGAIKIAIEETERTIHESNILVLGYGRIGKILCKRLKALGANIYCAARKSADRTWIKEEKCMPITFEEIEKYGSRLDMIINTVPKIVLTEDSLKVLPNHCIYIELASAPGGVDKIAAEMYNIRVIMAQGIPGKIAPATAARYIKGVIEKYVGGKT